MPVQPWKASSYPPHAHCGKYAEDRVSYAEDNLNSNLFEANNCRFLLHAQTNLLVYHTYIVSSVDGESAYIQLYIPYALLCPKQTRSHTWLAVSRRIIYKTRICTPYICMYMEKNRKGKGNITARQYWYQPYQSFHLS